METSTWQYIGAFIQSIVNEVQLEMNKDTMDHVNHYLTHDEYEMAFELLFLELFKLDKPPKINAVKSKEVGELLKLNEESVFDFEFWEKFVRYLKNIA